MAEWNAVTEARQSVEETVAAWQVRFGLTRDWCATFAQKTLDLWYWHSELRDTRTPFLTSDLPERAPDFELYPRLPGDAPPITADGRIDPAWIAKAQVHALGADWWPGHFRHAFAWFPTNETRADARARMLALFEVRLDAYLDAVDTAARDRGLQDRRKLHPHACLFVRRGLKGESWEVLADSLPASRRADVGTVRAVQREVSDFGKLIGLDVRTLKSSTSGPFSGA